MDVVERTDVARATHPQCGNGRRALLAGPLVAVLLIVGLPTPSSASPDGLLSGTVTGGGAALANVWVTLTPVTRIGERDGTPTLTTTDGSGHYEFPELHVRHVKVHARAPLSGGLVDTYWPAAPTFAGAGTIPISSWPVTADVDLPIGGSVEGRVVDADTGAPVEGAQVTATIEDSPASGFFGAHERVEGPGRFAIGGLPPVPMVLHLRLPLTSPYLGPAYGGGLADVRRIDGARTITGMTIGLRRGAEIRGTVHDRTGQPLAGAHVRVYGCPYPCPPSAIADTAGAYRITGIGPAESLRVRAWAGEGMLEQWYVGQDDLGGAATLDLESGDVVGSVDFTLTRGALLTGRVLGAVSDEPLAGVVAVLVSHSDPSGHYFDRGAPTGLRIGPVPAGTYSLILRPGVDHPQYQPARWLTSTGISPTGIIRLAEGEHAEVVIRLGTRDRSSNAVTGAPGSRGPGLPDAGWPGLAGGFLAPDGWFDPPG